MNSLFFGNMNTCAHYFWVGDKYVRCNVKIVSEKYVFFCDDCHMYFKKDHDDYHLLGNIFEKNLTDKDFLALRKEMKLRWIFKKEYGEIFQHHPKYKDKTITFEKFYAILGKIAERLMRENPGIDKKYADDLKIFEKEIYNERLKRFIAHKLSYKNK